MKSNWWRELSLFVCMISPAAFANTGPCAPAIAKAAQMTGVPQAVLFAIARTESGRGPSGEPWPWLITTGGRDHAFESMAQAREFAQVTRRAGTSNFDLGCFQVNYRWHHENFATLDDILQPEQNALYAARFLAAKFAKRESWSQAAGDYHSMTPELAARYRVKFDRHLSEGGSAPSPVRQNAPTLNRYPFLWRSSGSRAHGSLVVLRASQ